MPNKSKAIYIGYIEIIERKHNYKVEIFKENGEYKLSDRKIYKAETFNWPKDLILVIDNRNPILSKSLALNLNPDNENDELLLFLYDNIFVEENNQIYLDI